MVDLEAQSASSEGFEGQSEDGRIARAAPSSLCFAPGSPSAKPRASFARLCRARRTGDGSHASHLHQAKTPPCGGVFTWRRCDGARSVPGSNKRGNAALGRPPHRGGRSRSKAQGRGHSPSNPSVSSRVRLLFSSAVYWPLLRTRRSRSRLNGNSASDASARQNFTNADGSLVSGCWPVYGRKLTAALSAS